MCVISHITGEENESLGKVLGWGVQALMSSLGCGAPRVVGAGGWVQALEWLRLCSHQASVLTWKGGPPPGGWIL